MKKYFDTHCHLNGQWYKTDIQEDILQASLLGVDKIVIPGTCYKDSLQAIELSKKYPTQVYAAVGIHPCDAFETNNFNFINQINPNDIVAIGETGIDLYHNNTNPSLIEQTRSFIKHIEFAIKYNKPLIVHARNAEKEVYDVLIKYPNLKFIMHCYTGDWNWANKFIELGGYISISGALTYSKTHTIEEVAKNTPLNRLLIETDAPFLTPVPHRNKTNKPEYVVHVANYIVSIRDEVADDIIYALYKNALDIFNL